MAKERLNEFQKEILKVYQETSKAKKSEDLSLTRQEMSKLLLKSPYRKPSWKPFQHQREREIGKAFQERKWLHEIETEKQAWTRRAKDLERPLDDWRERIGLGSRLRGIYSKKQEVLNRSLRDLVKKGYLEKSGSGIKSSYRITEKTLKTKFPKF